MKLEHTSEEGDFTNVVETPLQSTRRISMVDRLALEKAIAELPPGYRTVFTLHYENDDDGERKLGRDSKLTFTAPADGDYLVRVSDVRGLGGDRFAYRLLIRRPQPDFSKRLTTGIP